MQFTNPSFSGYSRRRFLAAAAAGFAGACCSPLSGLAREPKAVKHSDVNEAVERGLQWLKQQQAKDGRFEAQGGNYKTAMTGLAGMAFLMEGSSLREGKYSEQIRKAVNWLINPNQLQKNGLIADRGAGGNFGNYIHGHGFATMFLACAYGEAEDRDDLRKLETALTSAVDFSAKAQVLRKHTLPEGKIIEIGGWGYVSAADRDFDEGSTTVTQLQALRAARNSGIPVPKETIDRSVAYLEACTTSRGGIVYSYTTSGGRAMAGQERPPLTAAAICCSFSAGQYKSEAAKQWIKYCKDNIRIAQGRAAHEEYLNYYYAQFAYALGEERYGEMFPNEPKDSWLTWSKVRNVLYPYVMEQQGKDGAWDARMISPVYTTSMNLAILQLEKGLVPLYQR